MLGDIGVVAGQRLLDGQGVSVGLFRLGRPAALLVPVAQVDVVGRQPDPIAGDGRVVAGQHLGDGQGVPKRLLRPRPTGEPVQVAQVVVARGQAGLVLGDGRVVTGQLGEVAAACW